MDEAKRAEIKRRLNNWGVWARTGIGGSPGRCGSAEGRYLPPRDDDGDRLEQSSRVPIDVLDAERVERAVLRIRNPLEREVLKWWYVEHRDEKFLAEKLNVRPMLVLPFVWKATGAAAYQLDHLPAEKVAA